MVRSVKPSSFTEPARAEPARNTTATANSELRRMFIRGSLTKPAGASSVLLHAQVWDSGPVIEHARGGVVARLLVELPGPDLRRQRQPRRAAPPRFFLDELEQRAADAAPADVADHRHPLDLRHARRGEDQARGAAGHAVQPSQRVHGVARVVRIQLVAGSHALLLHENGPAQSKTLLDFLATLRDANVDHAFLGARNRSVATAQSTTPRQRNRSSETRSLLANPGNAPPTLTELRKFRVVSESCRNASTVPITAAPAIRPDANSTPGPLSASTPLARFFEVRSTT